ncbi:hypothetical protein [Streptomyces sp. NPDC006415]|uniref:hypothetical protein n=1 Tax=Streptomyces sp. NPDC006415 TaxID=3155351 RepID=UPI0033ACAA20
MTNENIKIAEESLGREIFGPLGGIVELGAVVEAGPSRSLESVSVADFVARHQEGLNRITFDIQKIGNFASTIMAIIDELGWNQDHKITAPSLLLWSGGIEELSAQLESADSVQRMLRAGSDLQMARLLHALVGAAVFRNEIVEAPAPKIARIMRNAATLLGIDPNDASLLAFRMWRTAFLPAILMPSTLAPAATQKAYREFAHELEDLLN